MISSVTEPSISRVMSSLTRRSSGPTPSMGLIAPPSTWYLPRNSRVRSIATTSLGSSTTQMTATSRRGSRQMRHCSSSATLPQMVQNRTLSLTSVRADTRRRTSTGSAARRWKAIRCALLGPTPGSRPSSSMRSWTAPSYMRSEARQAQAAEITETAGDRAHLLLGQVGCCPRRVAHGSDDEVLQRLDVVRVDGLGVDRHGGELATAGHRRPHQAAAGASLDLN